MHVWRVFASAYVMTLTSLALICYGHYYFR